MENYNAFELAGYIKKESKKRNRLDSKELSITSK